MGDGNNYTSPLLHTIKLTGLSPKTRYYYQYGPVPSVHGRAPTVSCHAASQPYQLPAPAFARISMPQGSDTKPPHIRTRARSRAVQNGCLWRCRVGDGVIFSEILDFTTLPAVGSNERVKIAVTADLGERTRHVRQQHRVCKELTCLCTAIVFWALSGVRMAAGCVKSQLGF